jgi:hypothetical protein
MQTMLSSCLLLYLLIISSFMLMLTRHCLLLHADAFRLKLVCLPILAAVCSRKPHIYAEEEKKGE